MYLDYFGLEKDPFTISPDPSFLYPSPLHRQALAHLKYGMEREGGFILLTGEVGTGKTTLTRLLLQQLPGNIRVAYILNARLGEQDLMTAICRELGVAADPYASVREYTDLLNRDLLAAHSAGKKTLLVIEEAQNLEPEVLEMLRLLTNLETNTNKLLHILLVAQPELLDVLARPELRQLNQRVVSRYHLQPLSLSETSNYLRHRMRRAGCRRPVFDKNSTAEIHRISGGIPRLINLLAERSLLGAYASSTVGVTRNIVKTAAVEVLGETRGKKSKAGVGWMLLSACVLAGVLVFAGWKFLLQAEPSTIRQEPAPSLTDTPEDDGPEAGRGEGLNEQLGAGAGEGLEDGIGPGLGETLSEGLDASSKAPLTETVNEPVNLPNAYTQLLESWGVDGAATREDELCRIASEGGLKCFTETDLVLEQLIVLSRSGLVRLQNSDDQVSIYLFTAAENGGFSLTNASGETNVSEEEFSRRWDGYFLYLWAPPTGYETPLRVGAKNPEVVDWLQRRILLWDSSYEEVITGGIYSTAISDRVRRFQVETGLNPDGILGRETVIAMNDLVSRSLSPGEEI